MSEKRILKNVRTECRNGELYQKKIWSDGTIEEKRVTDAQLRKLMVAIVNESQSGNPFTVIRGGKK